MKTRQTYYKVDDIPQAFISKQLVHITENWGSQPARTLDNICDAIAKKWAESANDPCPWLARMSATDWESVYGTVYSIYRNRKIEIMLLDLGFNFRKQGSDFYWFPEKVTCERVDHWLGDDFRGTMENPF